MKALNTKVAYLVILLLLVISLQKPYKYLYLKLAASVPNKLNQRWPDIGPRPTYKDSLFINLHQILRDFPVYLLIWSTSRNDHHHHMFEDIFFLFLVDTKKQPGMID